MLGATFGGGDDGPNGRGFDAHELGDSPDVGKTVGLLVLWAVFGAAVVACDDDSPAPTQTPTVTSSPTASPTAATTAALTPSATASPSAEATTPVTADAEALTEALKSSVETMVYWLNVANGTPPPCGDPCERHEDFVDVVEGQLAFCRKADPGSFAQRPGYSQQEHGVLVTALTESCGALDQGLATQGTVMESAAWKLVVAEALKPLLAVR